MGSCGEEMLAKITTKCDQKIMSVSGYERFTNTNALHQEENNTMHKR